MTSLGFAIPDDIRSESFYAEISQEQLDLLDRDVLLWELVDPATQSVIEAHPIYQQLDVAKEARAVFVVDPSLAAGLAFISVLSLPFVLEELVPSLAAAIDGNPATTADG